MSDRQTLTDDLAMLFNSSPSGLTSSFWLGRGAQPSTADVRPWVGDSEDMRRRDAVSAAVKTVAKPTRAAVVEAALRHIAVQASGRTDPVVRLAAIETLAAKAICALPGNDVTPDDPNEAREALDWRRACDDVYSDGITARKCGLGSADHGLALDNDRSRALAQAFALGWSVADEAAAFEDVAEAARLLLKFGDADSRDALRAAIAKLPCSA